MLPTLARTEVYDTYWRFAAERQAIYCRRLVDPVGPWTDDPILERYRFTNAYRAADRVSQYLIKEVQYRPDRSTAPAEVFFRTMLFKIFNKIETFELIEHHLGPVSWQSTSLNEIAVVLDRAMAGLQTIYSAAYIMPAPPFGHARKHRNHLAMLESMMVQSLPGRLASARSLEEAYRLILAYPGLGPFLAFQYAIDLNYSELMTFDEREFVVAGPGALDGLVKCFGPSALERPEELIFAVAESQEQEFARLGVLFDGLFGRPLQPIDCQNLFCEISKYSRVAHPKVMGASGRTRIKQTYKPSSRSDDVRPFFPPKWNLHVPSREYATYPQFALPFA